MKIKNVKNQNVKNVSKRFKTALVVSMNVIFVKIILWSLYKFIVCNGLLYKRDVDRNFKFCEMP